MKKAIYTAAPYEEIKGYKNVFVNNIRTGRGPYRIWRYVWDYEVDMPKLDVVPLKYKQKKGLSLFRYTQYNTLAADVINDTLTFISPALWKDPFESLLYSQGNKLCDIACICFTYDWIESEEAAWNRSDNLGQTVRVEYDFDKLCDELSSHSDYNFYFSVIDYSLPKDNIAALKKKVPSSVEDYLNMMSLKRKAFLYENEIRLFVVREPSIKPINGIHNIGISNHAGLIDSICLPPESGLTKESASIKGIKIKQSRLYSV